MEENEKMRHFPILLSIYECIQTLSKQNLNVSFIVDNVTLRNVL